MKILLCNKFYYRRGGDCIYTINLEQLLKSQGHEVAIFSQQYILNEPSTWSKYWPSEFKMKPSLNMVDSLLRPFGWGKVRTKFIALLNDFQPDVVHLNNIHTQLSPILIEIAHARGIRVIWTLHDTKLVCPCYTCMREGKWCEECFEDKRALLHHNCMKGGKLGSLIGYYEAKKWTKERLQQSVDTFICPSHFMANTMARGGYDREKLLVLSNFIDSEKVKGNVTTIKDDYFVYLGQLNPIKGIRTLCKVASLLPYKLVVIGGGVLEEELRKTYGQCSNIEFKGQLNWGQIKPLISNAKFMVLPSECSENNPISVIESLTLGTPVLGANIGGIPELLNEKNGDTFESGNSEALRNAICRLWNQSFDYQQIAHDAIDRYSQEHYYKELVNLYQ